jgi:hypothetical protein
MPLFVYEGTSASLSIAGRTLNRGMPTMLEGRAAESAAEHPDIRNYGESSASKPARPRASALTAYAELKQKAKALGIPAKGKADELVKVIAAEEKRLADEAAAASAASDAD